MLSVLAEFLGLDKKEFYQLKWIIKEKKVFPIKLKILDVDGSIKGQYKQMTGYAQFALDYTGSDMNRAFREVSEVLSVRVFKQLKWNVFPGTVQNLKNSELRY